MALVVKGKTNKTISSTITKRVAPKALNIDIYIKEKSATTDTDKLRIPWLPASIKYEAGGLTVATYDIMDRGDIEVPTGTGLAKVSWESQFPGNNRTDDSLLRGTWKSPSSYHNRFEKWKANGTALNLLVTGYPINLDVYLTKYSGTPAGGFGDMEYSVEFTEIRSMNVSNEVKEKTDQNTTSQREEPKYDTYTIKKGDTLWGIAKRVYGSGAQYTKIYDANKDIIEKEAKAHGFQSSNNGNRIWPGTILQIPKS